MQIVIGSSWYSPAIWRFADRGWGNSERKNVMSLRCVENWTPADLEVVQNRRYGVTYFGFRCGYIK